MSNNKQSSIEFFLYGMASLLGEFENKSLPQERIMALFEQAKAMHKEEKKQVLKDYFTWHKSKGFVSHKKEDIEDFINETFGESKPEE